VARFYIENFGCRATQADGAALERQFLERGLERAGAARDAEIVVLNTCTVTEGADKDARASIRRLRRVNPGCRILVTGCYAQRVPDEVAALPGVTWVVGNSHKHQAAEIATGSSSSTSPSSSSSKAAGFVPLTQLSSSPAEESEYGCPAAEGASDFEEVVASLKRCPDTNLSPDTNLNPATNPSPDTNLSFSAQRKPAADQIFAGQVRRGEGAAVIVGDIFAHTELMAAPVFEAANERTRPNLKVQDGCDNRCSFCVIPYVRGQSRSLPRERVIEEVNTLVAAGYREVVISGINLGRWGRDLGESSQFSVLSSQIKPELRPLRPTISGPRLESLIHDILEQTSLQKLRISSVEPMDWSDDLIELMASSGRIAKHAHVPMQSGSDAVLRRMHRKYRPWHYREKILRIRAAMPKAAIGADVMVGFPGETEQEFAETCSMIEELPFTYLHVFTYSARPGTLAAELPGQVPVAVARERNRALREIASSKKAAFMRSLVGTVVEAITLQSGGAEFTEALSENYLKMRISGRHEANRWMDLEVEGVDGEMLVGNDIIASWLTV
jgi:MiaB/RimO family radical SAM methylthiotransferase